jgi:hypothetical protein
MDYRYKPLRRGPFWTPIGGPFCEPIDTRGDIAHAGHHPERWRRWAAILGRGGKRRSNPSRAGLVSSLNAHSARRPGRQRLAGRQRQRSPGRRPPSGYCRPTYSLAPVARPGAAIPQSDRRHPGTARRHGKGETPTAVPAAKVAGVLRGLETYVSGQSDLIIDYATARRGDEPISAATTESTVQWLLHRRMGANQQMRWSSRGAHLMLKTRTSVINRTFNKDYAAAERWARRPFRNAA